MQRRIDVTDLDGKVLYHYFVNAKTKEGMERSCKELTDVSSSGYYKTCHHVPVIGSEFELGLQAFLRITGMIPDDNP